MKRWSVGIATALCLGMTATAQAAAPTQLTVGDNGRPLNVEGEPRFGWRPGATHGNDVQTAYEIKVTKTDGSVVWDSNKVASSSETYVPSSGAALGNGAAYQ